MMKRRESHFTIRYLPVIGSTDVSCSLYLPNELVYKSNFTNTPALSTHLTVAAKGVRMVMWFQARILSRFQLRPRISLEQTNKFFSFEKNAS